MPDGAGLRRSASRKGLAVRLLLLILGFSSLVTLAATGLQLWFDYARDVAAIEARLDEIERAGLDALSAGLWNVDTRQLQLQLDGLLRLPDMHSLEVREDNPGAAVPITLSVHRPEAARSTITRVLPLVHRDEDGLRRIGTLTAVAALDGVHERLRDRVAVILLSQFVKTVMVSAFIFMIVHLAVTRHISAIADHFRTMGTEAEPPPLRLRRRRRGDELDDLVESFNALTESLHDSYAQVSRSSAGMAAAQALAAGRAVKLETAHGELRRLAMVTAHHLQEPLRPMAINAQRIARRLQGGDAQIDEWCASVTDGTTRLGALLRDFQRYVEALGSEPRLEPCDSGEIARQVADRAWEDDDGPLLEIGTLPQVTADRHRLAQVFEELLDNARRHAAAEVTLSARRLGEGWEFEVADDGPGFDPAMAERVFEIFELVHGRAADRTGLGLPMCKAILRAHGGTIRIDTAPEQGTRVCFTLPDLKPT